MPEQRLIDLDAALAICQRIYEERLEIRDYCGDTVAWDIGNEIKALPAVHAVVLPCKVGDQVWHVDFDECGNACDVVGDIFVAANDEIVLCAPRPYDFHGGISQYIFEESEADEHCAELNVYERDNCYATCKEARVALAERRADG